MITEDKCYSGYCDNCGEIFNDGEYSMFPLQSDVKDQMQNSEWYADGTDPDHKGKHYCPDCFTHHLEIDDKIVVDSSRYKPAPPDPPVKYKRLSFQSTLPTQSPSSIEEPGLKEGEHVWPLPEQYKTDSPYKAAVYFGWYHGLVNGYTHKFTWEEYLKTHPLRKPKENEPELTEHQQEILSLFSKEELWDIVNYWDKIKKP